MKIAYSKPTLGQEEDEAVLRVLHSGWLAAGSETEAFEKEFAEYVGVKYAIFTNSCTSALKIAYKWASYHGYRVAKCPRNTFCATYSAAQEMGLTQSWHDIDSNPGFDLGHFRVNVHYGSVKDETSCLIEDSAHRIEPNDPLVGKIRCYSFYVTKNMTTSTGGMLVTNDKEIYDFARLCWKDGLTTSTADRARGAVDYDVKIMAGGYDGDDLRAAIGRAQLKKLPEFTKRRNEIRDRYNQAFGQTWMGNHLYCYFVSDEKSVTSLRQFLDSHGIKTSYNYPKTGWLGVSLPIYPLLTEQEQLFVIEKVKQWKSKKFTKSSG